MFCVGTMRSGIGWETDSVESAMNDHMYYWFVSRERQSKLINKVPSFYALWRRYGETPEQFQTAMRETLELYMKELFPVTTVTIKIEYINGSTSLYRLSADVQVTHDNVKYSLAKVVEVRPENFELLDKHRLGS